jgi:hypothetical protein
MTAQEKADELIDKMYYVGRYDDKEDYNPAMAWERAKQCALIAVKEIINSRPAITDSQVEYNKYWNDVKSELQSF